jgi:hypothetical protein
MRRSHQSCFHSWSGLITFNSSEANKEVPPGSIEAFGYASLRCYCERKAKYTELFSFFSPSRSILSTVEPRHRQCPDRTTPRCHSAVFFRNRMRDTKTSWADHCRAPCCLHQIPGWLKDRCSPTAALKGEALAQNRLSSTPPPLLFFLQLALATLPLVRLSHQFHSLPSKLSSVFVRDVEKKLGVDRKKSSSQAATHDPVFGRVRVFLLDIDRDVPLYRRRNLSAIGCACAHSSPVSS